MKPLSILLTCNLLCSAELITYHWPNEPHRQAGYDVTGTIIIDIDVSDPDDFTKQILPNQITSFDLQLSGEVPVSISSANSRIESTFAGGANGVIGWFPGTLTATDSQLSFSGGGRHLSFEDQLSDAWTSRHNVTKFSTVDGNDVYWSKNAWPQGNRFHSIARSQESVIGVRSVIPEPSSYFYLMIGVLLLWLIRKKPKR